MRQHQALLWSGWLFCGLGVFLLILGQRALLPFSLFGFFLPAGCCVASLGAQLWRHRLEKEAEKTLYPQQEDCWGILREMDVAVARFAFQGERPILYANKGMHRLCGYAPGTLRDVSFLELIRQEERQRYLMETQHALEGFGGYRIEYTLQQKVDGGEAVRIRETGRLVTLPDGQRLIQATLFDVSDYHNMTCSLLSLNQHLHRSEQRCKIVLSHAELVLFEYLPESRQIVYYPELFSGFQMDDVLDDSLESFLRSGSFSPPSLHSVRRLFAEIDSGADKSEATVVMTDARGKECVCTISLLLMPGEKGTPPRAVGVIKDATIPNALERLQGYNSAIATQNLFHFVVDMDQDVILSASDAFTHLTATSVGAVYSVAYLDMIPICIHPDDVLDYLDFFSPDSLWEAFSSGKGQGNIAFRFLGENGQFIWVESAVSLLPDSMSGHVCAYFSVQNIDERKKREQQLEIQQNYYAALLSDTQHTFEIDLTDNLFLKGSLASMAYLDAPLEGPYQDTLDILTEKAIHPEDRSLLRQTLGRETLLEMFSNGQEDLHCDVRICGLDSLYRWYSLFLHLFRDKQSGHIRGFGHAKDIHDIRLRENELIFQAQRDGLTGLYNKRYTESGIGEWIRRSSQDSVAAFYILDLDNFKAVNDTFGHACGDTVLSDAAAHIRRCFPEEETIIGRIGGDEFVVFQPEPGSRQAVSEKVERLIASQVTKYTQDGVSIVVNASIGIAFCPQGGQNFQQLYENADQALYYAKSQGKSCCAIYDSGQCQIFPGSSAH